MKEPYDQTFIRFVSLLWPRNGILLQGNLRALWMFSKEMSDVPAKGRHNGLIVMSPEQDIAAFASIIGTE